MHKMIDQSVESPCVRNCCLDDNDICIGCGRHLDEITGWQGAGEDERRLILQRAQQRCKQRQEQWSQTDFRTD